MDIVLPYFAIIVVMGFLVVAGIVVMVKARGFRKAFGVLILCGCPLFFCVCGFFGPDIYQTLRLGHFSRSFDRLSHPTNTVHVALFRGNPHHASNWCSYFVADLRTYSGDQQGIVEFYRRQQIPAELLDGSMYVLFVGEDSFEPSFPIYDEIDWRYQDDALYEAVEWRWGLSPAALKDRLYYIVYFAYTGSYYFDYRCH